MNSVEAPVSLSKCTAPIADQVLSTYEVSFGKLPNLPITLSPSSMSLGHDTLVKYICYKDTVHTLKVFNHLKPLPHFLTLVTM